MQWEFHDDKPIYAQLVELVEIAVAMGKYLPGERLPGVRELAAEAGVNPNTMQRALAELESRGLLFAQRTSGRFVTEDAGKIAALRNNLASERTQEYLNAMRELGFGGDEIAKFVRGD